MENKNDTRTMLLSDSPWKLLLKLSIPAISCNPYAYAGFGRASKASVLVLLRQIIIYIPAVFIMPHVAGLGVHGVFCAPLITDVIVLIVVIWMMRSEFKRMDQLKAANR